MESQPQPAVLESSIPSAPIDQIQSTLTNDRPSDGETQDLRSGFKPKKDDDSDSECSDKEETDKGVRRMRLQIKAALISIPRNALTRAQMSIPLRDPKNQKMNRTVSLKNASKRFLARMKLTLVPLLETILPTIPMITRTKVQKDFPRKSNARAKKVISQRAARARVMKAQIASNLVVMQ